MDTLKVYVYEAQRQLHGKVKITRSETGSEYYGKYNKLVKYLVLFKKFPENDNVSGSVERQSMEINEVRINISLPINVPTSVPITNVVPLVKKTLKMLNNMLGKTLQEDTNSQILTQINHKQCH